MIHDAARASPGAHGAWSPVLTDREFRSFQELIQRLAGIHLSEHKRALLVGRLAKRLRERGVSTFTEYYELVTGGDEAELTRLFDCICTNETRFFRESDHFALLAERLLPELEERAAAGVGAKRVRVWSAACSTGEEPYSLAMLLRARFPASSGWEIEIVATDLSTRVLERAREAVWPIDQAAEIPYGLLRQFMLRGTGASHGTMKAAASIRSLVSVQRMNLNDEHYEIAGPFDLVFCRNVLIYFETNAKARVLERLMQRLAPHGYLFLGHAETLGNVDGMEGVAPNVYRRKRGMAARVSAVEAAG